MFDRRNGVPGSCGLAACESSQPQLGATTPADTEPWPSVLTGVTSLSLDTEKLQRKEERPKPSPGELFSSSSNLPISEASSTLAINLASPGSFPWQAGVHIHSC